MRQQRPRGSLTRAAVIDAALAITDEVGSDAVTIRAVAKRIGVPPMSLYTHFASKQELLGLMGTEVARRLYADAAHVAWEAEVASLCHQVHRLLLEHPRWTPLLSWPLPAMSAPLRERLLALMTSDGVPLADAFTAVANAGLISLGLTLVEITLRDAAGNSSLVKRFERLKECCEQAPFGAQNPLTRAALSKVGRFDANDNFAATIRLFIEGVKATRVPHAADSRLPAENADGAGVWRLPPKF